MANNFYHVGFAVTPPYHFRFAEMDVFLNTVDGVEWLRYSFTAYILWTALSADDIYGVLQAHIRQNEQVLIARLDMDDRYGFMSGWIWKWIDDRRNGQPTLELFSNNKLLDN